MSSRGNNNARNGGQGDKNARNGGHGGNIGRLGVRDDDHDSFGSRRRRILGGSGNLQDLRRTVSLGENQPRQKMYGNQTKEELLEEMRQSRPISSSDSKLEEAADYRTGGTGKRNKSIKKTYKKLKQEVFTPVLERARRVSRTLSRPVGPRDEWSSDEEDKIDSDPLAAFQSSAQSKKRGSLLSTESERSDNNNQNNLRTLSLSEKDMRQVRQRRKSATGFLLSYASNKLGIRSTEEYVSKWTYRSEAEDWERENNSGEGAHERYNYVPEDAFLVDLHDKEVEYLRSSSLERYNEQNTGVNASIPKDPTRKSKRTNSLRKKNEKEKTKLLTAGIFGMPLHVVLDVDNITDARNNATNNKCIRDKNRRSLIEPLTPKIVRRFNSLKARSTSPLNLSPSPRVRSLTAEDYFDGLVVNSNCLMSRSLSTPSTPLDSRKLRPVSSTSALFDNKEIDSDLLSNLSSAPDSTLSLASCENPSPTIEVPMIIQRSCQYLTKHGLDQEGLFRVCGAKRQIRTLRAEFNTTSIMDVPKDTNPHTVAGLLKEFLKDLPESLTTKALYYPFIHCTNIEDKGKRLEAYRHLIRLLPATNRDTLQYLLNFCKAVSNRAEDSVDEDNIPIPGNKMNSSNLAIVIGPNILHRRKTGGSESKSQVASEAWESPKVIEVVKELIDYNDSLFIVDKSTRLDILQRMHETKQSHFDTVLNTYVDYKEDKGGDEEEEEEDGELSPGNSPGFKGISTQSTPTSSVPTRSAADSSSGFVSEDSPRRSVDHFSSYDKLLTERQLSSPDLRTNTSQPLMDPDKRLSKSLEDQSDPIEAVPTTSADPNCSKDSVYDLTPPSSPVFERSPARQGILCKSKVSSKPLGGYGALSPNQTYTQFRLDKITVQSPKVTESRKHALKKKRKATVGKESNV